MRSMHRTVRLPQSSIQISPTLARDRQLLEGLAALREDVHRETRATLERWRPRLKRVAFLPSALNLASYVAFRKRDVRPLQDELAVWGLSSLGRSESHVLANLDAVLNSLAALTRVADARVPVRPRRAKFQLGGKLLARNTRQLFGRPRGDVGTH